MDEFGDMLNKSGMFDESFNGRVEIQGVKLIEEDMHNIDYVMEDSINESSLSEFVVRTSPFNGKQTVVKEYGMDGSSNELKNSGDFGKNLLLPTDVKKANELTPTMMQVLTVRSRSYLLRITVYPTQRSSSQQQMSLSRSLPQVRKHPVPAT